MSEDWVFFVQVSVVVEPIQIPKVGAQFVTLILKLDAQKMDFYCLCSTKLVPLLQLRVSNQMHCKHLQLQYISTMALEMYPSSGIGVRLQDVDHYISSTSISHSADVLQFKYILSVVLYTV